MSMDTSTDQNEPRKCKIYAFYELSVWILHDTGCNIIIL